MAHIVYEQSFREARKELEVLESQFQDLTRRRETLQSLVDSLGKYLQLVEPTQSLPEPQDEQEVVSVQLTKHPAWFVARSALLTVGKPMNVPDIHKMMEAMGVSINPDAIRIAMIRKPEIFTNAGSGLWMLTAWRRDTSESEHPAHMTIQELRESEAQENW